MKEQGQFPLPVISDNCNLMKAVEKYSDGKLFKIYCLEHKLSIIEKKLHKRDIFAKNDSMLTNVHAFFNHRHQRFNLPLKPPSYGSTTRPWRSYLNSYKVNYLLFI